MSERWPAPREPTWLGRHFGAGPATLGELARYLALWAPADVKGRGAAWTRRELERAFVALLEAETGAGMRRHAPACA